MEGEVVGPAADLPNARLYSVSPADVRLFNSLTGETDALELGTSVGVYVCGITPYDAMHLGHAFTYTVFDVLVRLLRFLDYDVTYVQNITDVDDDILARARALGMDWKELGEREVDKFLEYSDALNILRPDHMPRATEHIPEITSLISVLLGRGIAYESNGNIYFEVKADRNFGARLLRQPYPQQLALANQRGNVPRDPRKRDPLDFVLWQSSGAGEPTWDSPLGKGRPGWHIECSAMSRHYLGDSFAIHGGGADLLFPHHECEIAQSMSAAGVLPARYWLHTAMVEQDGEKMSKSLGNMTFVSDLLSCYSASVIRVALLRQHYRQPWAVDMGCFDDAQKLTERLQVAGSGEFDTQEDEAPASCETVLEALLNDLDTPRAIDALLSVMTSKDRQEQLGALAIAEKVLGLDLREQS